MLASREASYSEDDDEEFSDDVQIPASLLLSLNQKDPKCSNQEKSEKQKAAEERVFQILESIPTEIEADPSLKKPARRKPYDRRNPQVPSPTNYYTSSVARKHVRQSSPRLDLEELSKLECPEEIVKPGINLISVPISQTDKKYTRIEPDDEDLSAEVEIVWPTEVEQLIKPCLESQHQCPMVDYLREKIHDSKLQTRRAWETVRETLQKAREKEQLIRQLNVQLQDVRHSGGLPTSLVADLKEARKMSSYATMSLQGRKNAEYVFHSILRQTFPNFSEQDISKIFNESMHFSGNYMLKGGYGYIQPEISNNIAKLEKRLDTPNETNVPSIASNRPVIKINPANQALKNVAPLAVIEPKFGPTITTPQLLPKRMTFADKACANSEKAKLSDVQKRERNILKTHPTKQYVPPERIRASNKKPAKQTLPFTRLPLPPTLVRTFPPTPQIVRISAKEMNPRQNALEFAIQQRANSSSFDPKRAIPIRPSPNQRPATHKSPSTEAWRTFVTGRTISIGRPSTSSEYARRLPTSSEMLERMASATEIAQQENKRRLEALCPVKSEPLDYD